MFMLRSRSLTPRIASGMLAGFLWSATMVMGQALNESPPASSLVDAGEVRLPLAGGERTLRPESPLNRKTATAWRPGDQVIAKFQGPAIEPRPVVLTDGLIIRSADEARLRRLLTGEARRSLRPVAGAPGFYVLSAGSVEAAAQLSRTLMQEPTVREAYLATQRDVAVRGGDPDDTLYPNQWHLNNTANQVIDINAPEAWALGYTGQGIVIGIIDNGVWIDHPDLNGNLLASASQAGFSNGHATSVAGLASAIGFNGVGVRGVAYDSQFSNLYFGPTEDTAAEALGHLPQVHHIMNNSWGPFDNGIAHEISSVELAAIENGAINGRGGKGVVYIWAGGNGGTRDRVDYDQWASSRYTIAVGWIGDEDTRSDFSASFGNETGSAMMCVTYSSGNARNITTTTLGSTGYTSFFGGSSASAPIASGVTALMLEANPELTWRDVQHIFVNTARINDPMNAGWVTNAAGRKVSYDYGFGAIDGYAAVHAAETWTNVPPATSTSSSADFAQPIAIPDADPFGVSHTLPIEQSLVVEHVEVEFDATHPTRGDLIIELVAPSGTSSIFALSRNDGGDDYDNYRFTSVRHWGELSAGEWTLNVIDAGPGDFGTWNDWTITIHGTLVPGDGMPGDLDGNGVVNMADLTRVLANFQGSSPEGDANGDGVVDIRDLNLVLGNLNKQ